MRIKQLEKLAVTGLALIITTGLAIGCGKTKEKPEIVESTKGISQGTEELSEESADTTTTQTSADSATIRLAVQSGQIQPYIAQENGYFEEEGVDVEFSTFTYGPPIVEAMTTSDIDIGLLGDLPAYSAIVNGVDIRIIGTYETSNQNIGLLVNDNAGIKSLEDLKGKRVSVPFGSNGQPLLYLYLDKAGLTEDDVEIVNLSDADGQTSIIKGDIDATIAVEPYITSATAEGNGVSLLCNSEGVKDYVSPIIARTEFVEQHPDETAKLLSAFSKAAKWASENPEEAAQIVSTVTEAKEESVLSEIEKTDLTVSLTDSKIKALKDGVGQAYRFELIKKDFDLSGYIDTSYLEVGGVQ